ncbi:MAG: hypothetical protein ACI8RD_008666 [Bacillariaceae sp.]|jgi:hypothetical protein
MVLKMINIVDVDVNCLKRGSCEHHDCLSSSSCRKVEEEEFEIQRNKKQALECERERNIIIIDDDDIPSTCIDDTTTSTTTSTIITPKQQQQQQQQQHQPSPRSSHASRVQVVSITKKAKNKKVVRFTSECENVVYGYPRPTKDEKIDMYMSKDDYKNIIMTVVEGMNNNNNSNNKKQESNNSEDTDTDTDNDNELCIECILVQQNSDRIERVKSAISIILQRQKEQKYQKQMMTMTRNIHMNIIDDDSVLAIPVDDDDDDDDDNDFEIWLDKFYRQPYSKLSSKLARNRGLCDQELILSSLSPRTIVMTR